MKNDYFDLVAQLKSDSSDVRIDAAEKIRDIYEFEYVYRTPERELVDLFVEELLKAIEIENNYEVKFQLFNALNAWCYFPSKKTDYSSITKNLDKLEKEGFLVLALDVLIASGDKLYKPIYLKYSESEDSQISQTAIEGLGSIRDIKKNS